MQSLYPILESCDNIVIASPVYFSLPTAPVLSVASRIQTYFCQSFFRKSPVPIAPKRGGIILAGGGSGSASINEAVRKHLKSLTEQYFVLHVCGKGNMVKCNIKSYLQFEFIADMGKAYACADLVIARAGAGTLFELLALKKPALLIPLEGQTRGDQVENAAYFAAKGLCHVLKQDYLFTLPQAVDEAFSDAQMKERLQANTFQRGNERILSELKRALQ
jgi:UDP-N-acetylglucosamine--N-acetylmuramyl-(pentapeptide) pyrophosphoryl-undecaprenol N-acetylglucosamine transferase